MSSAKLIFVFALVVAIAGCAGAPETIEQLEQARSEVQALAADPMASQAADQQLKEAREALQKADDAVEQGESREEVEHLAYVAQRKAQIGLATTAEARARNQVAKAEAERNRVLLQSREQEVARARAELAQMQQAFVDLEAKKTDRGMVMTLGDVLFDTGKSTLKSGADLTMNRLANFLSENPQVRIVVEGHTDSVGSHEYNEGLSQRRADAVATAMETRGIDPGRIEVRGRGEDFPVAGNDTAAGRQQNRRVEIVFSDMSGRFARGRG